MNIVHLCVSNFYIDRYAYQENELVAQNVKDGHQVTVIASTESFNESRKLTYLQPADYIGADGARVIRLPYRRFLPQKIMRKLRVHPGIYHLLTELAPDVILFHGTCGWELNTTARYRRAKGKVKLYVDSHEDFNNSARTWSSKWLLHSPYYKPILKRNLDAIEAILCVNVAAMDFVGGFYGVPKSKLEFFPLGGKIFSDAEYESIRNATRVKFGILNDDILFVQSGKMDASKKLIESLTAFSQAGGANFRFLLVGSLQDDIEAEALALIGKDPRIRFEGWKTPDELRNLLCAADVYVQPGSQSATMQMSLCCRCAVILDDVPSHRPFLDDNGWLVGTTLSLAQAFAAATRDVRRLPQMAQQSAEVASRLLDYKSLARRLYR